MVSMSHGSLWSVLSEFIATLIERDKGLQSMDETLSLHQLEEELETRSGFKLNIRLNNNYSTMLSVRKEGRGEAKVSLHRIFLSAPQKVIHALASFIRGRRKPANPVIRAFIEEKICALDYTHRINRDKLVTRGRYHNLSELYNQVNRDYFHGQVQLYITWYGKTESRARRSLTYGLYFDPLKLIKIHRRLDRPEVPSYVVAFVIYHEILHYLCPPELGQAGRMHVHTDEFKKREAEFLQYREAQRWIQQHGRGDL